MRAALSWVMFLGWGVFCLCDVFAVGEGFFVGDVFCLSCLVDFCGCFWVGVLLMFLGDVFGCVGFGLFGKMVEQDSPLKPKIEQRKLEKRSGKCESKALGSLTVLRHDDTKRTVGRIGWLAQISIRTCGVYTYYGI